MELELATTQPARRDRFRGLRQSLELHRAVTAQSASIAWCVGCEVHHAPRPGGLCPVCEGDREQTAA